VRAGSRAFIHQEKVESDARAVVSIRSGDGLGIHHYSTRAAENDIGQTLDQCGNDSWLSRTFYHLCGVDAKFTVDQEAVSLFIRLRVDKGRCIQLAPSVCVRNKPISPGFCWFMPTCAPASKLFRRAGGVPSEAIRRLCVVRSEGFLQPPAPEITGRSAAWHHSFALLIAVTRSAASISN
jgi:hypothetical protein